MECHWRMDDDGISFGMADGMTAKFERRVAAFYYVWRCEPRAGGHRPTLGWIDKACMDDTNRRYSHRPIRQGALF